MPAYYETRLETRQEGGRRLITGVFPYMALGTIADRGRTRKERFAPGAFRFSLEDALRDIRLLRGHAMDHPLASRSAGTLDLTDSPTELRFAATLPPDDRQPSWVRDTVLAIEDGLMLGLSPGFRVPPSNVVPNAEELIPEPGNPGVFIRQVNQALLTELSVVTSGTYKEAGVEIREELSKMDRGKRWLLTL